ncbi:hypothetical protein ES707_08080 [subsurface metagenome]
MSNDKIKVRKRELFLIKLIGIPVIRMVIGIFGEWAKRSENEYDDQVVEFLKGLLTYLETEDLFEIT